MIIMKVRTWGNSTVMTLPKTAREILGLSAGDEVEAEIRGNEIVMTKKNENEGLTFEELFSDYSGEVFKTELNEMKAVGAEKW
ncbi:AbrB/MazE/SpoVT family DNA-binding domain-containing protein [Enterococcus faecalis]|nr:AbrB/MazE/SpoVT family DNA-binding domain-containing protein [Enterococcus faecalis]